MIEQYLLNTNESATVVKSKKISSNTASVETRQEITLTKVHT
jgi:hypothetical protein